MKLNNSTISRSYIFSNKELKEKLGIKGYIQDIALNKGLSPIQMEKGISEDRVEWEIISHEDITKKDEKNKVKPKRGKSYSKRIRR